jgi:UPF0755 protein
MRRRVLIVVAAVFVGLVGIMGIALTMALYQRPTAGPPVLFTVQSGEAFSTIRDRLANDGLVGRPRAWALYAMFRRYDRQIKAGTYLLTPGERPKDILSKLVAGEIHRVSITIPEGFMHRQIAGVLGSQVNVDSTQFARLLTDDLLLADFQIEGSSVEGYLFPDTYLIPWGLGPREIARTMIARLDEVFDDTLRARAEEMGLTRHELLTLASIVEAETKLADELPRVSAVYHNRLRKGMRLEADPTVAYAMGGYKGRLFYRDLEIDSPYNTYKHDGLPPGPICNPGRAAIVAALYPDTTSTAMYFVAQGDGRHVFSRTLSEHLAAVRKVRETHGSR